MAISDSSQTPVESPGLEVKRRLDSKGLSQSDFAEIVGYSEKQLSQILTGTAPLTLDFALRLEQALAVPAAEWLRKETEYRLALEKGKREKELLRIQWRNEIYGRMPIREMVKLGWIPDPGRDTDKLVAAVKDFWRMPRLDFSFMADSPAMLMRSSEAYQGKFNACYAATWLHKAQDEAAKSSALGKCDREAILALGGEIPAYSTLGEGASRFQDRLGDLGVKTLFLPHLPQTYLDGAAFFSNGTPVVALTRRLDRVDNFWFVLAHELAHVCLHLLAEGGESRVFVECEDPAGGDKEDEANRLASEFLGHARIREHFARCPRISRDAILAYCREAGVHPGIVVGHLQHIRYLPYYNFNDLKSWRPASAKASRRAAKTTRPRRAKRRIRAV